MKNTLKIIGGIAALIALGLAIPTALTRPDEAARILRQSGYKNIQITGWRPFISSDEDVFSTGFEATSPNGERVTGAVTSGVLKGGTIRLD